MFYISLYVTGDTHGEIDFRKLTAPVFRDGKELTKDDFVLICGDFGGVWSGTKSDKWLINWYDEKPWTTLFVDGNHENHDALDNYPVEVWNGGKIHRISDSVIHLMRGQVYLIDGHKIFTMGGATSHDKEFRREGLSWWARENPSTAEFNEAFANLESNDNRVEYVFTHCAPASIQDKLNQSYEKDAQIKFFENLKEFVDFKRWFFGHYHRDKEIEDKFTAVYYEVIKLW